MFTSAKDGFPDVEESIIAMSVIIILEDNIVVWPIIKESADAGWNYSLRFSVKENVNNPLTFLVHGVIVASIQKNKGFDEE